jgi:hypothetical protein
VVVEVVEETVDGDISCFVVGKAEFASGSGLGGLLWRG